MKYSVEQQASFSQLLSMMKGTVLRLRPLTSAFVGMREKAGGSRKIDRNDRYMRGDGKTGRAAKKHFNFGSILRLRTFAFIIAGTVLLVVYINNLLTINSLSMENERLRERIGISKSINAALELQLQEIHAVHNITARAEGMGLKARIEPAVIIRTD